MNFGKNKGFFSIVIILFMLTTGLSEILYGQEILASKDVTVKGLSLSVDPVMQNVPVNTPSRVNTVFSIDNPETVRGMLIKGELSGPGLSKAITLTTLPNHPFSIPAFPIKGKYILKNIRVEKDGQILINSDVPEAVIDVIDLIITGITTRPLSLEEIKAKGIVITDKNFTAYEFSIGFIIGSEEVIYKMPVAYTNGVPGLLKIPSLGGEGSNTGGGFSLEGSGSINFMEIKPVGEGAGSEGELIPNGTIPGILVFNNDIAFLNQFFSIMFIVSNNAPDGSSLALKDMEAILTLPDALREAETNPPHIKGTPIPIICPGPDKKLGTSDDLTIIMASFSGMSEFLAEGLKEGQHIVNVDFKGTLSGLSTEDVAVSGSASGMVIVKNPEFSITFAHPSVVRSGEEYDIHVTMTNISPVPANLVSFTMPASRLIGTKLLSDDKFVFDTIKPGESETFKFHMLSRETGKVRASAFEADGNVKGRFVLTAGVGESGIPLSPDTLTLPGYAYRLPGDLINSALELLGQAYSLATTPAGGVPEGLPTISRDIVKYRVYDLAEAGQMLKYGEDLLKTIETLSLDWLGNSVSDLPFDVLRRITSKGEKFAIQCSKIFNEKLVDISPLNFQKEFAENNCYKKPFISALFPQNGSGNVLKIKDYYGNILCYDGNSMTREIPFGELFVLKDSNDNPVHYAMIGVVDENGYTVEIEGKSDSNFDLSLIVTDINGGFKQVVFSDVPAAQGSISKIDIKADNTSYILQTDLNGDGNTDESTSGSVSDIVKPELSLLSVAQDCDIDKRGRAVALFFNMPVDKVSAQSINNYYIEGKSIYSATLQSSGRILFLGLNRPISPFVESRLKVSNILPTVTERPIKATITTPGGIVYGRVLTGEGNPISNLFIQLVEVEGSYPNYSLIPIDERTDSSGNFQFDYVRILKEAFQIRLVDPVSKKPETLSSKVRVNGQRYKVDFIMRGRGAIKGSVKDINGTIIPGASITIRCDDINRNEVFITKTDESGSFIMSGIPVGRVSVFAGKGRFFGSSSTSIDLPNEEKQIDIIVSEQNLGRVTGRVLESDGVTPVNGTYVDIAASNYFNNTETDAEGYFKFESMPIGGFSLRALVPNANKFTSAVTGTVIADETFNAVIFLRGFGNVKGIVLSHLGAPLENILVYIANTNIYMYTGNDGLFTFSDVNVGDSYTINARNNETGETASKNFKITSEGQTVNTEIVFRNNTKSGIVGRILEADGITPVRFGEVFVGTGNYQIVGSEMTDDNGYYSVNDLGVGSYIIAIDTGVFAGKSHAVIHTPGQIATCNLTLTGRGSIIIKTFNSSGDTGIMAQVKLGSSTVFEIKPGTNIGFKHTRNYYATDENGNIRIDGIFARNFNVEVSNEFYPEGARFSGTLNYLEEKQVTLIMQPTGKIKVKVVSYDDTVVSDAKIILKAGRLPAQETFTDENGEFEYTLVPPGGFNIEAEDTVNGYKGIVYGSMGYDGGLVEPTVKLKGKGKVIITVKNGEEIIHNAIVTLNSVGFPYEKFSKTSAVEGKYTFDKVSEGKVSINVRDENLSLGGRGGGIITGHGDVLPLEIKLEDSGTIKGKVIFPGTEVPVSNAQIILTRLYGDAPFGFTLTDENGNYSFENVPMGGHYLKAVDRVSGRPGKAIGTLNFMDEILVLNMTLESRGSVSGIFFDGSGVTPVAGASVKITGNGKFHFDPITTTTNSDGYFSFEHIGEGGFILNVTDDTTGLSGTAEGIIEYEDHEVEVNIISTQSGKVSGKIFKNGGMIAVSGARVVLKRGKEYTTYTDSAGNYEFKFIPIGSFTLRADYSQVNRDYGTGSDLLSFNGQEVSVNINFKGLGKVTGTVRDGSGTPLTNKDVVLSLNGRVIETKGTDANGVFLFEGINLGDITLYTRDSISTLSASESGVLVSNGEILTLDLNLDEAGKIIGTVLEPDGVTPSVGCSIKLSRSGSTLYATTDSAGNFAFNSVKKGDFDIKIEGVLNSGRARIQGTITDDGEVLDYTGTILDNVSPSLVNETVFPAPGAVNVPINTIINMTFSEQLDPSTINNNNIKLLSNTGQKSFTVLLSQDGKVLTLTPQSSLESLSLYTLSMNGIADYSGNPIETSIQTLFTTLDNIAPLVLSVSPLNGSLYNSIDSNIIITFSEALNKSTFTNSNISLLRSGTPVSGAYVFNESSHILTFTPTELSANSPYTLTLQNYEDISGNIQSTQFTSSFTTADTEAPVLTLLAPPGGTTVKEGAAVLVSGDTGSATDINRVVFFINGEAKLTDSSAPYTFNFTAPQISGNGSLSFLVEAIAFDNAGNQSDRVNMSFALLNDNPPQISLTGPAESTIYPGQSFSFSISASDDVALSKITAGANGGTLNYTDVRNISSKSFSWTYNVNVPSDINPGTAIVISAASLDSKGNSVSAQPVNLKVPEDSSVPTVNITSPAENARFKHNDIININADVTDDIGVKKVNFYIDEELLLEDLQAPYTASYTVLPLDEEKNSVIRVEATDLAGKITNKTVNIIQEKLVDLTAPVVKIVTPSEGSLVFAEENLKIRATATDDEGVTKVEFYVDGVLIDTKTEAPYEAAYLIPADVTPGQKIAILAKAFDVDDKVAEDTVTIEVITGTFLPDGTIINADNLDYDNQTIIIKGGTVTINGSHTFTNILVKEGALLTHSVATTTTTHKMDLTITGKLVIGSDNSRISVNSSGYLGGDARNSGSYDGRTLGNTTEGGSYRSGGSYGGFGGKSVTDTVNKIYGSIYKPSDPGSGGGCSTYSFRGGNGGGVLKITASELLNDGEIKSDGGAGSNNAYGAGSGGSIWISATTLKGSGTINANGGTSSSGAGGGGRVAVYYETLDGFDISKITAYGGNCTQPSYYYDGGAGTVYLKQTTSEGELIIDNNGLYTHTRDIIPFIIPGTISEITVDTITGSSADFMVNSLIGQKLFPDNKNKEIFFNIISNTKTTITLDTSGQDLTGLTAVGNIYEGKFVFEGYLKIQNTRVTLKGRIDVNTLSITGGSYLNNGIWNLEPQSYLDLNVVGNILIDSNSCITANARGYLGGYAGGNESRYGRTLGNIPGDVSGSYQYSGGSYGGYGGEYNSLNVNNTYGSIYEPSDPGSGGGGWSSVYNSQYGGNGGGVLKITSANLLNDGEIRSDGGNSSSFGAGSGGSIWINAATLKGQGTIHANGGTSSRGAGGGGRIAVYYETIDGFDLGKITAYGGNSTGSSTNYDGGAGTVYLKKTDDTGKIVINNGENNSSRISQLNFPKSGTITAIEAYKLTDTNAEFIPGVLIGMRVIPNNTKENSFRIISNTKTEIFTDSNDGDMTLIAKVGDTYKFKFIDNLRVENSSVQYDGDINIPNVTLIGSRFLINGTLSTKNLDLQSDSIIYHSSAIIDKTFSTTIIAEKISIDETSRITANSQGYLGGYATGNTNYYGRTLGNLPGYIGGSYQYSGGSYGGYGGKYLDRNVNNIYGSIYEPSDPGSGGGGYSTSGTGGNGGGVLKIVTGELLNDGDIRSDGGNSTQYGAGSGGSIWINAATLKGLGAIHANGGTTSYGAGGGGRIAVYYETIDGFDLGKITAYGGDSTRSGANCDGGAGTVYLKQTTADGELIIDNNGLYTHKRDLIPFITSGTISEITGNTITDNGANFVVDSLIRQKLIPDTDNKEKFFTIISNTKTTITVNPESEDLASFSSIGKTYEGKFVFDGHLKIQNSRVTLKGRIELNNLSITGNSYLSNRIWNVESLSYLDLNVAETINIDSTSFISVNSQGYLGGYATGNTNYYGRTLGNLPGYIGGSYQYSGGSYGGYGGKYLDRNVNNIYGSIYEPSDPGSGGGGYSTSGTGGNGGGVLKIVTGELLNDGDIRSDGGNSTQYGAGSGGSIWINAATLKGLGAIHANGGTTSYGAGGGGRIAVYYETIDGFDLSKIIAYGGDSTRSGANCDGGAGTVYIKMASETYGDLIIDNNGVSARDNSTPLPSVGAGVIQTLNPFSLTPVESGSLFTIGALKGITLILNNNTTGTVYKIINNSSTELFTDPDGDDMTNIANPGESFRGILYFRDIYIRGFSKVYSFDELIGTKTVEAGSVLNVEEHN